MGTFAYLQFHDFRFRVPPLRAETENDDVWVEMGAGQIDCTELRFSKRGEREKRAVRTETNYERFFNCHRLRESYEARGV